MNEAELTGFRALNCAIIQQLFILKFAFGPEKLPCLSRNGPLDIVETAYFVTRIRMDGFLSLSWDRFENETILASGFNGFVWTEGQFV